MSKFGTCCCGCCVDLTDERPTITIPGYTASGDWVQGLNTCCWKRTYTNNSSAYSVGCASAYMNSTFDMECIGKLYATSMPMGPFYYDLPPCPGDVDKCCYPTPPYVQVGESVSVSSYNVEKRLKVEYRINSITVVFSKLNFVCDGVTECKYMLGLSYSGNYIGYDTIRTRHEYENIFTPTGICVSMPSNSSGSTDTASGSSDCLDWPAFLASTGTYVFNRVLLFDVLPAEGNHTFNSSSYTACTPLGSCHGFQVPSAAASVCVDPPSPSSSCYEFKNPEKTTGLTTVTWPDGCVYGSVMYRYTSCDDPEGCFIGVVNTCEANASACSEQTYEFDCESLATSEEGLPVGVCLPPGDAYADWCLCGASETTEEAESNGSEFYDCNIFAERCAAACCHVFDCGDFCSSCYNKFGLPLIWENTLDSSVTNSPNPSATFCIPLPSTTITIAYP